MTLPTQGQHVRRDVLWEGCCSCRCGWRAHRAPPRSSKRPKPPRTCSQSKTRVRTCNNGHDGERRWPQRAMEKYQKTQKIWPEYGALSRLLDHVVLFILRQHFGEAKISNLHPWLALHQNIPRCQVSVNVALAGQVLHSLPGHRGEGMLRSAS